MTLVAVVKRLLQEFKKEQNTGKEERERGIKKLCQIRINKNLKG